MAKIIVNCRYMKGGGKAAANLVEYMGTRPGVEYTEQDAYRLNPATVKQAELIAQLERLVPDLKIYFEYEDYQKNPTIENASALIIAAQEYNLDLFSTRENLMEYMGNRPGAVRVGEHGLWGGQDDVDIRAAMDEVANHPGTVWTHVVSLRREDAERLGYNSQKAWRDLAVSQTSNIAKAMKIPIGQLQWYGAFHNQSHHPHMHLVVFSVDGRSGYLSKAGIEKIRSGFAHEIFKQDFYQIYERKQLFDDDLIRYSRERMRALIDDINADSSTHSELERLLTELSADLCNHRGKKVYGFLKSDVKARVDAVVRALAADPRIAELYRGWCECRNEIIHTYKFDIENPPPLEKQPEFRSIHNAVIKAAGQLNIEPDAQPIIADRQPGGDFVLPILSEKERKNNDAQEQKRNSEAVIPPTSPAQTQAPQSQARPQAQACAAPAALAIARLLRSLGGNVYNSYQNGHDKLFTQTDRRQLQRQTQKQAAQGHRRAGHEQTHK